MPSTSHQVALLFTPFWSSFSCPCSSCQHISPADLRSDLRSSCTLLEHSCEGAGLWDSFVLVSKSAGVEAGRAWKRIIQGLGFNYWSHIEHQCPMRRGRLERVRKHMATLEPVWKSRQDALFPHRTFLKISTRYFNQLSDSCECTAVFRPQFIFIDILLMDTIWITTNYAYLRDWRQTYTYI